MRAVSTGVSNDGHGIRNLGSLGAYLKVPSSNRATLRAQSAQGPATLSVKPRIVLTCSLALGSSSASAIAPTTSWPLWFQAYALPLTTASRTTIAATFRMDMATLIIINVLGKE